TPAVTISEPAPGQLHIDLGANTFDPTSTARAPGLTYEVAGAPGASHFATLDMSRANNIPTLEAALPGDALTLGVIANGTGGLGGVAASAGAITVAGLDTSHAGAGGGNVDLKSAGALTVAEGALLATGAGTLALAAGVDADGTGSSDGGVLFIADGATVGSANAGPDAITLRGADIEIDTGPNPGLVGAQRVHSSTPPILAPVGGMHAPAAVAFDALGFLGVANSGAEDLGSGSAVSLLAPGSPPPTATLTGLSGPRALAFDAHGNLFVANFGDDIGSGTTV